MSVLPMAILLGGRIMSPNNWPIWQPHTDVEHTDLGRPFFIHRFEKSTQVAVSCNQFCQLTLSMLKQRTNEEDFRIPERMETFNFLSFVCTISHKVLCPCFQLLQNIWQEYTPLLNRNCILSQKCLYYCKQTLYWKIRKQTI